MLPSPLSHPAPRWSGASSRPVSTPPRAARSAAAL